MLRSLFIRWAKAKNATFFGGPSKRCMKLIFHLALEYRKKTESPLFLCPDEQREFGAKFSGFSGWVSSVARIRWLKRIKLGCRKSFNHYFANKYLIWQYWNLKQKTRRETLIWKKICCALSSILHCPLQFWQTSELPDITAQIGINIF